jgi:hypothetical protein
MRGEFLPVWGETWRGIWLPLAKHRDAPRDVYSELYRALVPQPVLPDPPLPPSEFNEQGELVRPEDIDARSGYERAFNTFTAERPDTRRPSVAVKMQWRRSAGPYLNV